MSTPDIEHKELSEDVLLKARRATCNQQIDLMVKRMLIPFLGAGVNLAHRPPEAKFCPGGPYLPNASELSENIAATFDYPWCDKSLLRVAWYATATQGNGKDGKDHAFGKDVLRYYLHEVFSKSYPWNKVHQFFARLPRKLKEKGYPNRHPLIVTTNYDRLLERAFDEEEEPYDVVSYGEYSDEETGESRDEKRKNPVPGFKHTPYNKDPDKREPKFLFSSNEFIAPVDRTIILKIHGAADRESWERSSFVITEDDYIDYLALRVPDQIPATLKKRMLHSRFLYLGYSLGDWNFRVLLRTIKARSLFDERSWAIMNRHEEWDPDYWEEHKVRLDKCELNDYIDILTEQLEKWRP
jgi:hypothetical protein